MEQLLTMIFLLTIFAAVFLQARPYDKASLDAMECISLISNLIVLFGGFMFFSELLSEEDAVRASIGIQVLLVGSLLVLGIFIIADTLPSICWVIRAFWNERKTASLKRMRLKGDESSQDLSSRSVHSNFSRLRMIVKQTVPHRITKVGRCRLTPG